jgi:predicted RNA-binding protein with PIN domain
MPYLIDGHNLIPLLGIRLTDPDDEAKLIARLQEFCRLTVSTAEVYLDDAPPGWARRQKSGRVTAIFVRDSQEADDAIVARLKQLGNAAKNYIVVSNDQRVQREARALRAKILPATEFAALMSNPPIKPSKPGSPKQTPPPLAKEEVDFWLEQFEQKKKL